MIILDEPYISTPLLDWMEKSAHPVLDGAFLREVAGERALNYVDAPEAIRRIDAGERIYTNSENTLSWILENTHNESLTRAVTTFKDKALMREILHELNPDLFFMRVQSEDLASLDFESLPKPFVIKPSVGFGSMGVYAIDNLDTWHTALADIAKSERLWQERYPESVIETHEFILEGYLTGTEYAIDAYFDEHGKTQVLNVFRHDFANAQDMSDRMYITSPRIVREMAPFFKAWLDEANARVGARNFPVHVEVRVDGGRVSPIEFNPLRFAGLGCTDMSLFNYGYRTYEVFLENKALDFDAAFAGKDNKVYSMSLLNPPAGIDFTETFDYEALCARFSHVVELRRFDIRRFGAYGFLFLEVESEDSPELEFLKTTDLREFIISADKAQ